jgi:hypothetical protein
MKTIWTFIKRTIQFIVIYINILYHLVVFFFLLLQIISNFMQIYCYEKKIESLHKNIGNRHKCIEMNIIKYLTINFKSEYLFKFYKNILSINC